MNKLEEIELPGKGVGVGGVTDYARTEYGGIICNLDDIHEVGILGLAHRVSDKLNRFIDRKPDRFLTQGCDGEFLVEDVFLAKD